MKRISQLKNKAHTFAEIASVCEKGEGGGLQGRKFLHGHPIKIFLSALRDNEKFLTPVCFAIPGSLILETRVSNSTFRYPGVSGAMEDHRGENFCKKFDGVKTY